MSILKHTTLHPGTTLNLPGLQRIGSWMWQNLAVSVTDLQGTRSQALGAGASDIQMPYAGILRAITVRGNANCTAGSATFTAWIAGSSSALAAIINTTDPLRKYVTHAGIAFAAGDIMEPKVTTTALYLPITVEFVVDLWGTF